jgi:predicted  nucleic acid-binding Zn-ribbon protein
MEVFKMAETLADLQKQKEDIKILLSTLEEAYGEASITEEHYNEVKGKNQKKLEELSAKIEKLEKKAAEEAVREAKKEAGKGAKKKARKPREAKPEPAPAAPPAAAPSAPEGPGKPEVEAPTDYSGIPQPLTDIAGEEEAEARPEKAPGAVREEPGTLRYTADEIKGMLSKILKEVRPQGIEVAPRVDKLEVQLEKVRAYLDSMKGERSTGKEGMQRLTEEVGEIRSNVAGLDRRVSESEIKVTGVDEALGDLRPQRFLKAMREEDASIKRHEARLDKLDDMTSAMLKKLGQIEEVLKRLGSLEKIVNFSREAAKRLLEIENREKRIGRIADKIDGIFMELNKRLDEFVLYRAKQDTLDELSQEMMKTLDDMNTKLQKYAEKADLDSIRDTIEAEIASIRTGVGESPEVQKLHAQKTEIEGLIAMLDEQFKAGALPEKEYQKTRQINLERLKDLDKKLSGAAPAGTLAPSPEEWAEKAKPSPEGPAKTGEARPAEPAPAGKKPEEAKPSPESTGKPKTGRQSPKAAAGPGPAGEREDLLSELEDSLMKGLISRKAYEKTKRFIPKGKAGGDTGAGKSRKEGDRKE